MFTNVTNKYWSLVMNGLADVDIFKIAFKCACGLASYPWYVMVFPELKLSCLDKVKTEK